MGQKATSLFGGDIEIVHACISPQVWYAAGDAFQGCVMI